MKQTKRVLYIYTVVIGFSPPLAYCAIFSVMSIAVVDLHSCKCMCVFFVPAIDCTSVRIGCTPQLRSRRPAGAAPLTVPIHLFCLLAGE